MSANIIEIEERLWKMADQLRANTHLRAHEYSEPVLGLIFLKFAYETFRKADPQVRSDFTPSARQPEPDPDMYKARGALYLPREARYDELVKLPAGTDIVEALKHAMEVIEQEHPVNLGGALPKDSYARLDNDTLRNLLRGFDDIDLTLDNEEDTFGRVYEYFLSKFALGEGQHGGEFFTPESLVRLIVEIIEPYHGLILDPACGSGRYVCAERELRTQQ